MWSEEEKLFNLFEEGTKKLEKEMSIENILKDLRDVKIYLKRNHLDADH